MDNALLEKRNKPQGGFPFIRPDSRNLQYMAHYHEEIEVVFVQSGSAHVIADMNDLILNVGDICIFMPGVVHSFLKSEQNSLLIIKIAPLSHIENINFESIRLDNCRLCSTDSCYGRFRETIECIYSEFDRKLAGYEFAIYAYQNQLVTDMLRLLKYHTVSSNKHLRLINDVNAYIEQNYSQPMSLDDAAVKMRLSKYYFAHTFKELTGVGYMTYLCMFRIEKAKQLLLNSSKNIIDIALECGFGNVRSFNRMFKQQTGMSPSEYRKQR